MTGMSLQDSIIAPRSLQLLSFDNEYQFVRVRLRTAMGFRSGVSVALVRGLSHPEFAVPKGGLR
jgi:hypothetical protein